MAEGNTGGGGLPYLGSLMSLLTHGDVRYEGILADVNMVDSSLRLTNVICRGTEGRVPPGVNAVLPSDQIYETVVYKATEIKDLTVLQDASVAQGRFAPPVAPPPPPPAPSPWGAPAPAPGAFGSNPWGSPAASAPVPLQQAAPARPPAPKQQVPVPAPTVTVASVPKQQQPQQQFQAATANGGGAPPPRVARPVSYAHAAGGPGVAGGPPRGGGRGGRGRGGGRDGARGGPHGPGPHHQHPPHHHHHHHAPAPPITIPTEEFDFEAALKKFNKDELPQKAEEEEAAYKKDDFFDEISCEALEKLNLGGLGAGEGRARAAARRRTDFETFGGAARRGGGRGGGGYNGRGGRGRGRQPGGRGASMAPPGA